MAKYPDECPVFRNKLRSRLSKSQAAISMLPEIVIPVDPRGILNGTMECLRPDNQDFVYYKPSELTPLTRAARQLLKWSRQ